MPKNLIPSAGQKVFSRTAMQITAVLLLSLVAARGAPAQKISTEFDEKADFSKYKTFAVREGQMNARSPAMNGELTRKRVQAEIEKALTAKGLTMVTGPSDLNVIFTFGAARRVETETYPAGWRGLGTRVARVPYNEGTLVIDLRDPTTRSLVWRGIATETESNPAKMADKLDDMVKKSIAKYPPKK